MDVENRIPSETTASAVNTATHNCRRILPVPLIKYANMLLHATTNTYAAIDSESNVGILISGPTQKRYSRGAANVIAISTQTSPPNETMSFRVVIVIQRKSARVYASV